MNKAKKTFLGGADIIKRIYNWIDTDAFKPIESDIKLRHGLEGKFVLLAVASKWMDTKGLSAFIALADALPEDMALVMIGSMPQDREIDPGKILAIPATDSQLELAEWYSAADVFVSLSKEESFGKVTAEALSCGTPVISVNSTASPELVADSCGIVIDSDDAETALAAVNEIRRIGKAAMSENCREFALASFSMEDNIAAIAQLYYDLTH